MKNLRDFLSDAQTDAFFAARGILPKGTAVGGSLALALQGFDLKRPVGDLDFSTTLPLEKLMATLEHYVGKTLEIGTGEGSDKNGDSMRIKVLGVPMCVFSISAHTGLFGVKSVDLAVEDSCRSIPVLLASHIVEAKGQYANNDKSSDAVRAKHASDLALYYAQLAERLGPKL